jgi:hypothetical protein
MTARRAPRSASGSAGEDQRARLLELADALHPGLNRARTLTELDRMFRGGAPPDPLPAGFLTGRLLATQTWAPWDGVVQRIARAWMPWQGKTFDPESSTGLNRFAPLPGFRPILRIMFPSYRPVGESADRIDAFEFRTRRDDAAVDPGLSVAKIDYDFEANPALIRRILDELVQVGDGVYLGKILYRVGRRFHPIGFFMLEPAGTPGGGTRA